MAWLARLKGGPARLEELLELMGGGGGGGGGGVYISTGRSTVRCGASGMKTPSSEASSSNKPKSTTASSTEQAWRLCCALIATPTLPKWQCSIGWRRPVWLHPSPAPAGRLSPFCQPVSLPAALAPSVAPKRSSAPRKRRYCCGHTSPRPAA